MTSFVGRGRELADVHRYLASARLVTLTGPGGVGKTRLALEAAARASRAFADGVWLVDLATIPADNLVAQAIARELGVQEHTTRPVIDQLIGFLAERQRLIVLDNCEHVLHACGVVVDQLLRRCPRLRFLATSRQNLGINGEHVYPVGALPLPDPAERPPAATLSWYEAIGLLVERAAAVQPGFTVTEENRDDVVRLCAELDGIPLAIELAAARLRTLSVGQVVDRLADRFDLLTGGSPAALPRQRTLRALIDWSYDLCSAGEQRLWARLSVFAGGFNLSGAEEVCADEHLPRQTIFDLLDGLTARSVVARVGAGEPPRFRMLETIRRYGADRLAAFGDQDVVRRRHRDYFLGISIASAETWCGPGQEQSLARLRADHGNLGAALEWSLGEPGGIQPALQMCAALCWHWCVDGFMNDGRAWLDRVLAQPAEPSPVRVRALWTAAWIAVLQGDLDAADSRLAEGRRTAERVGAHELTGHLLSLAGTALSFRGRLPEAVATHREAVAALNAAGDKGVLLLTMFQLAMEEHHLMRELDTGNDEQAVATARQAIRVSEQCGDRWARSLAMWVLARCVWLRGDADEGLRLAQEGLELQRGFRDPVAAALMIDQLAWICAARNEFERAARLLGAADSVWRRIAVDLSTFGPGNMRHRDDCDRATRRALGEAAFRAAVRQGMQPSSADAIDHALHGPAPRADAAEHPLLTRRERQVADLVGAGLSNRQIAERLVLSPRTVDGHVEHVLAKLGFSSRAQISAWVAVQARPRQE